MVINLPPKPGLTKTAYRLPLGKAFTTLVLLTTMVSAQDKPLGAWQNPNIGVVADFIADLHDAESQGSTWRSEGIQLRAAELDISAHIDPFSSLHANILVTPTGAEMHEAFALFPFLPGNLKAKGGLMLANFGRWNRFHTHFMPFTSEPRIYHEYLGGMMLNKGLELSWLAPFERFLEITVSAYESMQGHTHDSPIPVSGGNGEVSIEKILNDIAREKGCVSHGDHWDCPGGQILREEDLLAEAGIDSMEPVTRRSRFSAQDFAGGGRARTVFEFGGDWSLDAGISGLYQHGYKISQRLDGKRYPKALYGADLTFFWHPLDRNQYRNADFGVEFLMNSEMFERQQDRTIISEPFHRGGFFSFVRYQHLQGKQVGSFYERFTNRSREDYAQNRYGLFFTYAPSHFQFFRIEVSRHHYAEGADALHRIALQYDAVIGYHTHGSLR